MGVNAALSLLIALLNNAAQISTLIAQAQAEGRDTLSDDQWSIILATNESARAQLVDAIAKAKAEGR